MWPLTVNTVVFLEKQFLSCKTHCVGAVTHVLAFPNVFFPLTLVWLKASNYLQNHK